MGLSNPSGGELKSKTNYLGSDCTGSDGAANRTLVHPSTINRDNIINVNGTIFIEGATEDYTYSASTFTFLGNIDDTDVIQVVN